MQALLPTACEVDADGVPIRVEDSAGKPLNHDHSDRSQPIGFRIYVHIKFRWTEKAKIVFR